MNSYESFKKDSVKALLGFLAFLIVFGVFIYIIL